MAKAKRTSAEVSAAAEWKAALRRQADELEQQQIETMELEEELEEEEEERNCGQEAGSHGEPQR
jgi:hypothetical protein